MHFIYILKLIPRLFDEEAWTKSDKETVGKHFLKLQELKKDGKLILAGRTSQMIPL